MKILVTGTAGFIGFHLANRLVREGHEVVGLDSINDYYSIQLKHDRLKAAGIISADFPYNQLIKSTTQPGYSFIRLELEDRNNLEALFTEQGFDRVVNLAAQAGVTLDRKKVVAQPIRTTGNHTAVVRLLTGSNARNCVALSDPAPIRTASADSSILRMVAWSVGLPRSATGSSRSPLRILPSIVVTMFTKT